MTDKIKYSLVVGLAKTAKNSAVLLIPFFVAILAGMPIDYAWITGPIAYFLKNLYETKIGK
ncbi:MAG: hypothetical protein PHS54_02920 [Clostridia bacterium]|nr:hypothetical protein [Clostridia bacterium]